MALQWLFLDMNSYFASVEQQFQPELRGRPVAVIPVESHNTCCIAASVEAKRFGIKSGTRVAEARAMCPSLVTVKARPAFYVQVHHGILRAIDRHAPIHKVYSIDEAAVRLVGRECEPASAVALARRIKRALRDDVGECLTCSIGIAPTRLLAKTACDMQKPDGLTVLTPSDLPEKLLAMKLDDFPGIGRNMLDRLNAAGITSVAALWRLSRREVARLWGGVQGEHWWCGLHGIDMPEVATHRSSMGHANVLAPEFRSEAGAHAMLTRLLHKAAFRVRHHGYWAHRLHAEVAYESGRRWRDEIDLPAVQDTLTLVEHFEVLWRDRQVTPDTPIKVAVTLAGLTNAASTTAPLFPEARHRERLARAIDSLNRRFGDHTVYLAGIHDCRQFMDDKIAFGRVPEQADTLAVQKPRPATPQGRPGSR
jgi:DNA polymerase-4